MTPSPHPAAAQRLTAALEQENAALAACDFAAIGGLLAEKEAALADLSAAPPPPPDTAIALATVTARNRALLERALAVQARIIALVARAAPPAPAHSYRAPGNRTATHAAPCALCARA